MVRWASHSSTDGKACNQSTSFVPSRTRTSFQSPVVRRRSIQVAIASSFQVCSQSRWPESGVTKMNVESCRTASGLPL